MLCAFEYRVRGFAAERQDVSWTISGDLIAMVAHVPPVFADSLHARVVFDARHPGSLVWAFPVLFFGATLWLAFIASAVRYFHRGDSPHLAADSIRMPTGIFGRLPPMLFPIVGAVVGALLYVKFRTPYVPLAAALNSGAYEVVEGVARDVRAGDPGGFSLITPLGARSYKYSEHAETPGFHGLSAPFEGGALVRVYDVGGYIAQIEVQK